MAWDIPIYQTIICCLSKIRFNILVVVVVDLATLQVADIHYPCAMMPAGKFSLKAPASVLLSFLFCRGAVEATQEIRGI